MVTPTTADTCRNCNEVYDGEDRRRVTFSCGDSVCSTCVEEALVNDRALFAEACDGKHMLTNCFHCYHGGVLLEYRTDIINHAARLLKIIRIDDGELVPVTTEAELTKQARAIRIGESLRVLGLMKRLYDARDHAEEVVNEKLAGLTYDEKHLYRMSLPPHHFADAMQQFVEKHENDSISIVQVIKSSTQAKTPKHTEKHKTPASITPKPKPSTRMPENVVVAAAAAAAASSSSSHLEATPTKTSSRTDEGYEEDEFVQVQPEVKEEEEVIHEEKKKKEKKTHKKSKGGNSLDGFKMANADLAAAAAAMEQAPPRQPKHPHKINGQTPNKPKPTKDAGTKLKLAVQKWFTSESQGDYLEDGSPVLHAICQTGDYGMLRRLMSRAGGCYYQIRNAKGETALHILARYTVDVEMLNILLGMATEDRGALIRFIDTVDVDGRTALYDACECANDGIAIHLLDVGANPSILSVDHRLAIDALVPIWTSNVQKSHLESCGEILKALVLHGVDINHRNSDRTKSGSRPNDPKGMGTTVWERFVRSKEGNKDSVAPLMKIMLNLGAIPSGDMGPTKAAVLNTCIKSSYTLCEREPGDAEKLIPSIQYVVTNGQAITRAEDLNNIALRRLEAKYTVTRPTKNKNKKAATEESEKATLELTVLRRDKLLYVVRGPIGNSGDWELELFETIRVQLLQGNPPKKQGPTIVELLPETGTAVSYPSREDEGPRPNFTIYCDDHWDIHRGQQEQLDQLSAALRRPNDTTGLGLLQPYVDPQAVKRESEAPPPN